MNYAEIRALQDSELDDLIRTAMNEKHIRRKLAKLGPLEITTDSITAQNVDVLQCLIDLGIVQYRKEALSASPHGTCPKQPHDNPEGGYLHGKDDNSPYDVDGCLYCGRCHYPL